MSLQTMLQIFTGSANTSMQLLTPLSIGRRDDAIIESCPFSHDVLFQVDHIVNLGAVHCSTFQIQLPTGLRSRQFGGHNIGGIKSRVSVVNSATVSLAR